MSHNLFRSRGISALAYTTPDVESRISCTLLVRYREDRMHATVSLQSSIPIEGFDDEQTFTLLFNADNLVPGTIFLKPATITPSQAQLDEIARHGSLQLTTLSLNIKKPCPIWCPAFLGSIAPKRGFDAPFHQLVNLARATGVHILFDLNWLHRDKREQFQRLISQPGEFTGFPIIGNDAEGHRLADWSVFSPIEDVVLEPLPSYIEVSKKRSRRTSTSSKQSPPSKRVLHLPGTTSAPSPTKKATTASTPSPELPPALVVDTSDVQQPIENAVEKLLPQVLKKMLPDMLPSLFGIPQSSRSPSPNPLSPDLNPLPVRKLVPSLGTFITARAAAYAESQLRTIYTETVDHALSLRSAADDDFLDIIQDHKLDVLMTKDDSIAELHREMDGKLIEFRDRLVEIIEEAGEQAEYVYERICARLDGLLDLTNTRLSSDGEIIDRRRNSNKNNKLRAVEKHLIQRQTRRAASSPL